MISLILSWVMKPKNLLIVAIVAVIGGLAITASIYKSRNATLKAQLALEQQNSATYKASLEQCNQAAAATGTLVKTNQKIDTHAAASLKRILQKPQTEVKTGETIEQSVIDDINADIDYFNGVSAEGN